MVCGLKRHVEDAREEDAEELVQYCLDWRLHNPNSRSIGNPVTRIQIAWLPTSLPDAFVRAFPHLQWLFARGSGLRSLPSQLGLLTQLRELDVSNNRLSRLPSSITALCSLHSICTLGNAGLEADGCGFYVDALGPSCQSQIAHVGARHRALEQCWQTTTVALYAWRLWLGRDMAVLMSRLVWATRKDMQLWVC